MGRVLQLLVCSSLGLDHQVVMPEGSTGRRVIQTSANDGWMPLPSLEGANRAAAEHPPPVQGVLFSFPFLFQVEAFKRPSFSEILDELEDVAESLEPRRDNQLSG